MRAKKKMEKSKIAKSWELKATSQNGRGVHNMKKFNEIIKDVSKTYKEIKELDEKIEELQSTYLNIMDIKERHEKMKTVENELVRLEEKK